LKNLIIIPARGGSKGIPRKNLRPLAGQPLISYSIKAALTADVNARVIVSTDDDEIALFANRFGADVIFRGNELSSDKITLDPVIIDAVQKCENTYNEQYSNIITVQPTSPLIRVQDIAKVVNLLDTGKFDTVLSVVDDRHLCWVKVGGKATPAYEKRVNRQQLPLNFKETGAVIACSRKQIETGTRIGNNVGICEVPYDTSFDIDNFADLYLCEAMLMRKKIIFTVVGYAEVGLGHAFRSVMLANELVQYDLLFVCEERSDLAIEYIKSHNYSVEIAKNGKLADVVIKNKPDLIINDILDTSVGYMEMFSNRAISTVNFEDMGQGHELANVVINALYPHQVPQENVLVGPKYFCLRDEFLHIETKVRIDKVTRVLITFGGVDEGNITKTTYEAINNICKENNIELDIIIGPAYPYEEELRNLINYTEGLHCNLIKHTKKISEHMNQADVAITSGGRTVLELASLKVPTIVICQNEREMTHTFASSENGIINLGHRESASSTLISTTFSKIISDLNLRTLMTEKVSELSLLKGKHRVISKIKSIIHE
jgi:CMP-N-acetylneuraminic acid synthetase/spore coat polysaccharide biosynthesis predicted glycosyltransferase SpsG